MQRTRRMLGVVFLAGIAGTLLVFGAGTGVAQTGSQPFAFSGGEQSFSVPADVCLVTVEAVGADGGSLEDGADVGPIGGTGGFAGATVPVTPGESLRVIVGGPGSNPSGANLEVPGTGGFGGGGDGGVSVGGFDSSTAGAGGGGASYVARGSTPLVVAGGGGGGGGGEPGDTDGGGGDGGGEAGSDGADGEAVGISGGTGGTGGTPAGPGTGGTNGGQNGSQLTAAADTGGDGGDGTGAIIGAGGGGGGGGFFGGAGGGGVDDDSNGAGGGGGGAGFAVAGATNVTLTPGANVDPNGNGSVVISWAPGAGCPGATPAAAAPVPIAATPRFTG